VKPGSILGKENKEYLNDKSNELATNSKNKTLTSCMKE
jgi:hypothetical protein